MTGEWDEFWRWEVLRRRVDPLDFRRWKSDSSRALRALPIGLDRDGVAPALLDASAGMGFHGIIQAELGFDVTLFDASAVALEAAREQVKLAGLDLPLVQGRWEELAETHAGRFDLVFNDELHQVRGARAMVAVLRGFYGCLRPGGALVFFQADATKPDDGANQCDHSWQHEPRERVAWSLAGPPSVRMTVVTERLESTLIAHHHVATVGGAQPSEQRFTLYRNFEWDWAHMVPLLRLVGFDSVQSRRFDNVHGRQFAMNWAVR